MIEDEPSARAWLKTLPEYDRAAQVRLEQFAALLRDENARQNLVSAASLNHVWQRHIADSAQLLLHVPRGTFGKNVPRGTFGTWLDLGTGAGFPGVIVAILRPDITMRMIESRPRRAAWLAQVCASLNLPGAQVIASRLELVETQVTSVVSARAFASIERLLALSARFSDTTTRWLLPKGRSAAHELQRLAGWQHMFHVEQSLTDPNAGIIVGQLYGRTEHGR